MITTITQKGLYERLLKAMKANLPILIKGAPGVGKSDIVSQVGEALNMEVIFSHPVVEDPTNYKGMPCILEDAKGKKYATFLPFGNLKILVDTKKPIIYFIDDLGQAPMCVQAACMQLLLAKRINGNKISDKVRFVACTNRKQDKAGVTGILEPVTSRFKTVYELVPHWEDWVAWATDNDVEQSVIDFICFRNELLFIDKASMDITNHGNPRTWVSVSDLLKAELDDSASICGAVGEAEGGEFVGFLRVYKDLPNIDVIIKTPSKANVPTEVAAMYAVVRALIGRVNEGNFTTIMKYIVRMKKDFQILFVEEARKKEEDVTETTAYIKWVAANPDTLL